MTGESPLDYFESLSSLTSSSESDASFTVQRPQPFWVIPPDFPESKKKSFVSFAETLVASIKKNETMLDEIIGEYKIAGELNLFARYKGGIARKYPAQDLVDSHPELVKQYERRKEAQTLPPFDPSAAYVHPNSRVTLVWSVTKGSTKVQARVGLPRQHQYIDSVQDSSSSDFNQDSDSSDQSYGLKIRINTRRKNVKKLPYSPRKTRSTTVQVISDSEVGSQSSNTSFKPQTRARTSAQSHRTRATYVDSDSGSEGSDSLIVEVEPPPKRTKPRARKASRAVYGEIRNVQEADDDDDDPLNAHRRTCEKCGTRAAHELPKKKKTRRKRDEFEVSSDDDHEKLGGWVRCLKCPVAYHWDCMQKVHQAEVLKAIRDKEQIRLREQEPEADLGSQPKRKHLTKMEMTEFICVFCSRGGSCIGCKRVVIEPGKGEEKPQTLRGSTRKMLK